MKTKIAWLGILAFSLQPSAFAAEGYVTKTASGTTQAIAYFPGGAQALRLTALDVTSDNATGVVTWAVGGASTTVAIAAAANVESVTTYAPALVSNDVVLLQNAAGTIAEKTVSNVYALTYKQMDLREPAGVACPVGTVVRERVTAPAFTLLAATAADPTAFIISNPNSMASNAVVLALQTYPIARALTGDVSVVVTAACKTVTLAVGALHDLSAGDNFIERNTNNTYVSVAYAYATNVLTVNSVLPFSGSGDVVIETPGGGDIETNTITGTNTSLITLGAECSFVCPAGTTVHTLGTTLYTLALPTSAATRTMVATATNGLASGDSIILIPTGNAKFRRTITGAASNTNVYTMTLGAALETNLFAGAIFYQLTNSYGVAKAAAAKDFSLILSNSVGLADGDAIVIAIAGVPYLRNLGSTPASYALKRVGFFGTTGLTLADGDNLWVLGTAESTVVGSATLRLSGESLRAADAWRPAKLRVTGASASEINSATAKYGP